MPRGLVVFALASLLAMSACRRSSPDASAGSNAIECEAVAKILVPAADRMDALGLANPKTPDEAIALLKQIAETADTTQMKLGQLQLLDPELARLVQAVRDALFVLKAMTESSINNANAGFIDALDEQIRELERFQADAEAADRAIEAYCL